MTNSEDAELEMLKGVINGVAEIDGINEDGVLVFGLTEDGVHELAQWIYELKEDNPILCDRITNIIDSNETTSTKVGAIILTIMSLEIIRQDED